MSNTRIQHWARRSRAVLIPAALCLAAGGAQAQLIGGLLSATGGLLTGTVGVVANTIDLLDDTTAVNYRAHRDAGVPAAKGSSCRGQELQRGVQRVSYGTAAPRSRQLMNDCTLMGAPTTP